MTNRVARALARPLDAIQRGTLRFLIPRRVRSYPAVSLAVFVCIALVNWVAGDGLVNLIAGSFGGDFMSFYTGGAFLRRGALHTAMDADVQHAFQVELLGRDVDFVSVWVSPPYFAWLFAPFTLLPFPLAFAAFASLSLVVVWLAFRHLGRELGLGVSAAYMLWVTVQFYPTVLFLANGQTSGLWIALWTGVFVLLRRQRDVAAGLLLGCFACKPQLALGLAVALFAARRWRAIAGAAGSSLGLVAFGWLSTPDAMRAYWEHGAQLVTLVRSKEYPTGGLFGSFELATILLDGISHSLSTVAGVVLALALLGAIASLWFRHSWEPGSRSWDLRIAATLTIGLIASPHLFLYDLALLVVPLFIVARHHGLKDGLPLGGRELFVCAAWIWAMGLISTTLAFAQQEVTKWLFGVSAAIQIGAVTVLLWSWLIARSARQSSGAEGNVSSGLSPATATD